ncbi:MAG: glycoside hydrolase family 13 protein [Aquiluna sp.]|nr:glycoside hydrolase family 13 protein [Aquiluna sp.]MCF8546077.1 glycoside hydrolase family 13 protein [Aquiluna sp.]
MEAFMEKKLSSDWWRQAVVYQIYPRSFADANGDGIGDLKGIISKADYLAALGIDAVWLSPFYPSALADGGYDVADYRDVDPRIGNLAEFDEMVEILHSKGIRIFVDVVPNHSSDQHVWFQEALKSEKGSKARERYIFRDGRGENGELPPSNLSSHFGPEGWTQVADGQWYMHLFTKEQPDFNWDNPEVHEDFLKTLKFWSDRGVDGYRIDVAHALTKNLDPLPDRDSYDLNVMKDDGTDPLFDRDSVHEIYKEWRALFNQYDPPRVAVAEAWVHPHRRPAYASIEGLGQAFNFDLLTARWDAEVFQEVVDRNLEFANTTGSSTTWVMSNHDVIRHATRMVIPAGADGVTFADENKWYVENRLNHNLDLDLGLARAKAATLMILALPGSTYLYQGEELGLPDVLDIPSDQMQDPQWFRGEGKLKSRDGCRVPLPWEKQGSSFGFGPGGSHLPQPGWYGEYSVEVQDNDENSTLNLYRRAINLRKELEGPEDLSWLESPAGTLAFERPGNWICFVNFGSESQVLPEGKLLIASAPVEGGKLPGNSTAWLIR